MKTTNTSANTSDADADADVAKPDKQQPVVLKYRNPFWAMTPASGYRPRYWKCTTTFGLGDGSISSATINGYHATYLRAGGMLPCVLVIKNSVVCFGAAPWQLMPRLLTDEGMREATLHMAAIKSARKHVRERLTAYVAWLMHRGVAPASLLVANMATFSAIRKQMASKGIDRVPAYTLLRR